MKEMMMLGRKAGGRGREIEETKEKEKREKDKKI